jgi:hypothetical protein
MWDDSDCATRELPGGGERPSGSQFEDFLPRRTVHSQTLVKDRRKVHVKIMNVSDRHQVPAGGTTLGRCEPVT